MCRLISIKRTKAFSLIRDKQVDSIKLGSKRLVSLASIERLAQPALELGAAQDPARAPTGTNTRHPDGC
jgi:hypothetical protein